MAFTWKMLHIIAISTLLLITSKVYCQVIQKDCQEKCGNITIPYPFGIGKGCYLNDDFNIICNHTTMDGPKPFLARSKGALDIIDISLDGYLRKYTYVAQDCYTKTGQFDRGSSPFGQLHKFYYSTRNKFTAVGCDTKAYLTGFTGQGQYMSGCVSKCFEESVVINGSCSGIGCCQISIPKQLTRFNSYLVSYNNHTDIWGFNPCSYAFIADVDYFQFSIESLQKAPEKVPTVLDWAIGDKKCTEAEKNTTSYACKGHSQCLDSDNGPGYRCVCSSGYQGNPYIPDGCVDINECDQKNDCIHKCNNTEGNYTCLCQKWYQVGDGRHNGTGCILDQNRIVHIIIGTGMFFTLLVAGSCLLQSYRRKKKEIKRKENFFKQNGGIILQDKIHGGENSNNVIKIFKSEELDVATNNFCNSRICGEGGNGTVYKGYLPDNTAIAIKKSKAVDPIQKEQFINEMLVLSQVTHQNVVKFLGCCFETPEPLLVYEFIANGTLSDHIHNSSNHPRIPWSARLKIAAETAGVLAYLHSEHSPPIIHRDIKPTNILLDDDYSSKVSDFGSSKLNYKNENEIFTMVQGTLGYLDPEYLQTGQLTEKSDVYSFGVVLIELLTGLKAISFEKVGGNWSLVNYFLSLTNEDSFSKILEKGMTNEDNIKEIMEVAKIAKSCVAVKGEERPKMNEVAMELESLLTMLKHRWAKGNLNTEETESLLGGVADEHCESGIHIAGYSGTRQGFMELSIDDGR